jgi:hypothetical protein
MKIKSATVGPMPRPMPEGMFDDMPSVTVTYEDATTEKLFEFYPDEIGFSESEFVGLTREQALDLRHKRDVAFLRS